MDLRPLLRPSAAAAPRALPAGTRLHLFCVSETAYCHAVVDARVRSPHVYALRYEDGATEVVDLARERFRVVGRSDARRGATGDDDLAGALADMGIAGDDLAGALADMGIAAPAGK